MADVITCPSGLSGRIRGMKVREDRVRSANGIGSREGLAAVSMERVARRFGITAMALYRYVPGKAELVALMLDDGPGPPPPLAGGWPGRGVAREALHPRRIPDRFRRPLAGEAARLDQLLEKHSRWVSGRLPS